MMIQQSEQQTAQEVVTILQKLVRDEEALRQQFNVGDQHRYIPHKLKSILSRLEAKLDLKEKAPIVQLPAWIKRMEEDERVVYIHLYHQHGEVLQHWERLLSTAGLDDLATHRPVYTQRHQVERILRARGQVYHHAYVSVIVKKTEVIEVENLVDSIGQPLVRLVEGSILSDKLINFVHADAEYYRHQSGRLLQE